MAHEQALLGNQPLLCDGAGHPVEVGEVLWSSAATGWPGFRLEMRRFVDTLEISNITQACSVVALCAAGMTRSVIRNDKSAIHFVATPGTLFLNGEGYEYASIRAFGCTDWLIVQLDMTGLERDFIPRSFPRGLSPGCRFPLRDPYMSALLSQMGQEARNGCPSGRLHSQSICLALAAYIHARYSPPASDRTPPRAKLSSIRMQRIHDYVRAHLSQNLSLGELAAEVQLSPSHFSELFKNTCALTPHQYVLRERVAEARRLLSSGSMSVIEVAHAVGYQDQSHFTTMFRKITQTTPKQFQLNAARSTHLA